MEPKLANKPLIYHLEIIIYYILCFQWKCYLVAISIFWLFIIYERHTFPLNNLYNLLQTILTCSYDPDVQFNLFVSLSKSNNLSSIFNCKKLVL